MADVFVSYKKEDRAFAERIVSMLKAHGRTVWWDEGLTPHQAWDATIEQEIAAAKAVVVLWSPRSVSSDWVRSEALYAQEHGKFLPVIIDPCKLPLAFALRQAVDLSGDALQGASPAWEKLDGWLSDMIGREAQGVGQAEPLRAPTRGETSRAARAPRSLVAGTALVALAAAASVAGWFMLRPTRPSLVVDPFELTAGAGLSPSFVSDLNDEMLASFSASSRVTPRLGKGTRERNAFQLSGRVEAAAGLIRVFAKVYGPGVEGPILTTELERPLRSGSAAPQELGLDLANIVRCIATGSDSNGSSIAVLPTEALQAWSRFCDGSNKGAAPEALIPLLRAVVAAAPRFANGWANLAETLAVTIPSPAADRAAVAREADAAAGTALAIDPRTAKAYVVKAWTRLPLFPVTGPDLFPAFRDFRGWQADVDKSLTVRPSDCGCEVIEYGFALTQLGRASAAIPYFERGAAGQSYGWEADAYRAYALALDGRAEQAKSILDGLAAKWPDVKALTLLRLHAALWRRDWASAQALLPEAPESAAKQPLLELVRALAKGDRAGVADSARALKALAAQGEPLDFLTPWGLAIAGLPDDAVAAADRVLATSGTPGMQGLFVPTFAQARRTPAFGRLVERTGIIDYWRQPGHRPDFCKPADAPPLCATL